jgi:hypothetical protein
MQKSPGRYERLAVFGHQQCQFAGWTLGNDVGQFGKDRFFRASCACTVSCEERKRRDTKGDGAEEIDTFIYLSPTGAGGGYYLPLPEA